MIGTKILEERKSRFNGDIRVLRTFGLGTYIQADGITQSAGVVEDIWRSTLRTINHRQLTINNCLILGLGGGTAAKLVRRFWSKAKITGVEIDPIMVEMGKKYMELEKVQVQVQIQDALKFLATCHKLHATFDLILVDLYQGDKVPAKFETTKFLSLVRSHLLESGLIIFNRLYYGEKRPEAMRFLKKLEKIFSKVETFYPQANMMFICSERGLPQP